VSPFLSNSAELPSDKETLQAMVLVLQQERDQEKQRAEEQKQRAEAHGKQAAELQVELLRLQLELERYKKWYYGPRADRLQSDTDVAQMLLNFAEALERKPIPAVDLPQSCGARRRVTTGAAAQGTAQSGQLREPACYYACLRVERSRTGLSLLWLDAPRDRRR
jgi:hypothetical protein